MGFVIVCSFGLGGARRLRAHLAHTATRGHHCGRRWFPLAQAMNKFGFHDDSVAKIWPKFVALMELMKTSKGITYDTFAPPTYNVIHKALLPVFANYPACVASFGPLVGPSP
jgi:hypothetical protein